MNKLEFLDVLQYSLSDLPPDDVAQSLDYYAEMIDDCIEEGMTEEYAVEQLGSPSEIADRIRMETPLSTLVRARASKARRPKGWEIALLILGSPVWLPILLSGFVILLSVYLVIWSVLISLYAVILALAVSFLGLVGLSIWTLHEGDVLHGTFLLGAGLVCGALAILLFLACVWLTKSFCRGTTYFFRKCKKRIIGKERAS